MREYIGLYDPETCDITWPHSEAVDLALKAFGEDFFLTFMNEAVMCGDEYSETRDRCGRTLCQPKILLVTLN
jgi:hypothetical protein